MLGLLALIVLLSVLDIFANVLSLIPLIGDLMETISESILEAIQILLATILAIIAVRAK